MLPLHLGIALWGWWAVLGTGEERVLDGVARMVYKAGVRTYGLFREPETWRGAAPRLRFVGMPRRSARERLMVGSGQRRR